MDLAVKIFDVPVGCANVPYRFFSANNSLVIGSIYDPNSCVGKQIAANGIDPSQVLITWDFTSNTVYIDADVGSVSLTNCQTKTFGFDPSGSYCGGAPGIVEFIVTQKSGQLMDLAVKIFGVPLGCANVPYRFFSANNSIVINSIYDPNSCVGKQIAANGLDPNAIKITWDPSSNTINIDADVGSISLETCGGVVPPKGSYCGGIPGTIELVATALSTTAMNITAKFFGIGVGCQNVKYLFNATDLSISIPELKDPNSCMGKPLNDNGIDPSSVSLSYSPPPTDSISITQDENQFNLDHCNGK